MSTEDLHAGELAPRLDALIDAELLVPIRSSSGSAPDPGLVDATAFRHGTDDDGERFIAAFSSPAVLAEYGPPGSDRVRMQARDLFERAWLLRAGTAWTAGVQLVPDALLGDFDAVRNRLHAVATEHLGSRKLLAVTDLRAPVLRDMYDATAAPFYVRRHEKKSIFGRIFGE